MSKFKQVEIYRRAFSIENGVISASKKLVTRNFEVHQHEFFEMEFILSGSGICTIDNMSYPIVPNALFFMTPANFHSVETANTELINISFSCTADYSDSLFQLFTGNTPNYILLQGDDLILVRALLSEVVAAVNRNDFSYSFLFLDCILRKLATLSSPMAAEVHSHVRRAVMYILENFMEDISLDETAAHLGLSKEYLSDLFSKQMGMGFKNYLDSLRFEYAEKLLAFSDLSIFEVCGKCGFSNYANFSRRFKKHYGLSASAYRQNKGKPIADALEINPADLINASVFPDKVLKNK